MWICKHNVWAAEVAKYTKDKTNAYFNFNDYKNVMNNISCMINDNFLQNENAIFFKEN